MLKSIFVSEENTDNSLVKEQVSVDENSSVSVDENSSVESPLNVDKEIVFHTAKKVEFVKPKNNEKPVRKSVSFNHVQTTCHHHQRKKMVTGNNYNRVDHNYYAKTSHPSTHRNMTPRAVLLKSGLTPLNTARPYTTSVNTVREKGVNAVKPSACWVWRPTRPNGALLGKPQMNDKGFVDSGCSRHMTRNMAYLLNFKEFNGRYVTFGGGAYGGRITGKGTLKTDNLDFDDVYSLPDESQILLKIPRKDNMYSFDIKNIVPKESLTCLVAKATSDESMLWHRRLGYINFKNINKLVKGIYSVQFLVNLQKKASYFDSPYKDVDNGESKFASDDQKQDGDGPDNENDEQDKSDDVSSPKEVNTAGQHVTTASSEVNTVDPSVNTTGSNDQDNPKYMFTIGASHTLEATHIEFFSNEDEPEVDLGNITNSYTVPTTPNTRIHKDHLIKNVIGDVKLTTRLLKLYLISYWVGSNAREELLVINFNMFGYLWICLLERGPLEQNGSLKSRKMKGGIPHELGNKSDEFYGRNYFLSRITSTTEGISQDKYVAEILKKFNYTNVKSASTLVDLEKPLVKDGDADDVDVHLYRSMIGSLMYLIASRPDIMFIVCACARFQVTLKTSHLLAVKRIFRYLKGKPTLGLWYSRDSPFELVAYTDSDYARATQDRKSTTGGYLLTKSFDAGGLVLLVDGNCVKKESKTSRHVKRGRDTKIPQSSGPPVKVGDEAVHKELETDWKRAANAAF
ncbi:uncharacterized mitochondrial protein-like protein [Tanacetum coccineum]